MSFYIIKGTNLRNCNDTISPRRTNKYPYNAGKITTLSQDIGFDDQKSSTTVAPSVVPFSTDDFTGLENRSNASLSEETSKYNDEKDGIKESLLCTVKVIQIFKTIFNLLFLSVFNSFI